MKVSREVADAIERIKAKFDFEEIIASYVRAKDIDTNYEWGGCHKPLNTLEIEELATALLVGYEVEMTPYEIIKADYGKALNPRINTPNDYKERFFDGYMSGVEDTLNTLGITIKGVNDNDN